MEEIKIKNINEIIYHEKFSSGLNVYIYSTDTVSNYNMELMVGVGSVNTRFSLKGVEKEVPDGVAHFLEHLTFNTKDGTAEEFFSKNGSYSNAFTDFDKTVYVCRSNNNFKENLIYLLNLVNIPFYNKDLVEKERGIIIEEVSMYENDPYQKLFYGLLDNLLFNDKHNKQIGGSVSDVKKITLDDIKNVYYGFYKQNNMNLIIAGNVNIDETINIIRDYENYKDNDLNDFEVITKEEIDDVKCKYKELHENVVSSKCSFGYKIKKDKFNLPDEKVKICLKILSSILFGETSILRDNLINNSLINDELGFYILNLKDYFLLVFDFESENIDEVIKIVKNSISFDNVNSKELDRKKKVYISNMIRKYENINSVTSSIENNLSEFGRILEDEYDIVNSVTLKELKELINIINGSPSSIIKLLPNE